MSFESLEEWVDRTVRPQNDFYKYVNGKWLEDVDIPPDKSRWGSFTILGEQSKSDVREILEDEYDDEEFKIVTDFYQTAMDTDSISKYDYSPIKPYLTKIDEINSKEDLVDTIIELAGQMFPLLFSFRPSIDRKNAEMEVPHLSSGGISMPSSQGFTNKDYYFDSDKENIRNKYVEYLNKILGFIDQKNSEEMAKAVLRFEKNLADKHFSQVQKRDPELSYNKMEVEELEDLVPNFDWQRYFSKFTEKKITFLVIDNLEFFELIKEMLEDEKLDVWKAYLKARVVNTSASYLSDRFEKAKLNFYRGVIQGVKEYEPRWKRVQGTMNSPHSLGHLIGKVYVERHFSETSKQKILDMVSNIQEILRERIKRLSWMTQETKNKALEKLDAFGVKIGFPDEWEDYTELDISKNYSYIENIKNAFKFQLEKRFSRLYDRPDPNEWYMSPQTVNAYYSPTRNEIVFPAAILQFPFFDEKMLPEEYYGGIGGVIAHEITHGFDDKGSKFDAKGNLNNWWTDQDREKFDEKGKYFVEEFSKFQVNGKPVNGELTLGENIADHGGVRIAFLALQKHWEKHGKSETDKLSPEERFFMSWARIWRAKNRPEVAEMLRTTDPHSPPEARVNVTLANIPEFHQVFSTDTEDTMYRENIQELW